MAKKAPTEKKVIEHKKKTTSIGHSSFTTYRSKNDKRNKKKYRGQG